MIDSVEKIRRILNRPEHWDFSGAKELYAGVDLGTYKAVAIVVDENGVPRACVVNLDTITTIAKASLCERLTSLSGERLKAVEAALHFSLGLER